MLMLRVGETKEDENIEIIIGLMMKCVGINFRRIFFVSQSSSFSTAVKRCERRVKRFKWKFVVRFLTMKMSGRFRIDDPWDEDNVGVKCPPQKISSFFSNFLIRKKSKNFDTLKWFINLILWKIARFLSLTTRFSIIVFSTRGDGCEIPKKWQIIFLIHEHFAINRLQFSITAVVVITSTILDSHPRGKMRKK